MNRAIFTVIALGVLSSLASVATADDSFETKAAAARRMRHVDDIVWALTASCDKGDEVQQRQCRLIRDKRAKALAGDTLLVDADPDAFDLGKWNPAKKSVSVTLTSCIACQGLAIDGKTWFVTGSPPRVEGGKVRAVAVYDNGRQFSDEASANAWIKSLKNVRVQMLLKVPDKRRWQVSGKDGLLLDVLGYRVVTPCDGGVIVASPSSNGVPADPKACTGTGATAADGSVGVDVITAAMVQASLKPVVDAANACFEKYGVAGKAKLDITIAGDGTVARYDQTGDFEGTPTGQCIDTAMREVQFPRSKRARTKIGYPIVLQ